LCRRRRRRRQIATTFLRFLSSHGAGPLSILNSVYNTYIIYTLPAVATILRSYSNNIIIYPHPVQYTHLMLFHFTRPSPAPFCECRNILHNIGIVLITIACYYFSPLVLFFDTRAAAVRRNRLIIIIRSYMHNNNIIL